MIAAGVALGDADSPPDSFEGAVAAVLRGGTTLWPEVPALDGSATVDEHLTVRGWTHCREGLESLTVTFDGQALPVNTGLWRPDVDLAVPGFDGAVSGFLADLDVRRLRPGEHRLAIVARGRDGRAVGREAPVIVDPELGYRRWLQARTPRSSLARDAPTPDVAIVGGEDERLARSVEAQSPEPPRQADLPDELRRLAAGPAEALVLVEPGGTLARHALALLAEAMAEDPAPDLVYADEDAIVADGGRGAAFLKPGWSPELLLATDYVGPLLALNSRAARAALEAAPAPPETLYEVALALVDSSLSVARVPEPLYTAHAPRRPADDDRVASALEGVGARRGSRMHRADGARKGLRRVGWEVNGTPLVSIVIPSRSPELLRECLSSIGRRSTYRQLEIVVVDSSGGEVHAALPALDTIDHRVVPYEGAFNYSRAINLGAVGATGEYLILLNDDTEVLTPDWVERLLEHAQSPGVGVVGCKLLYEDGRVQHGGVGVAAAARGAWHLYLGFEGDERGYRDTFTVARNTSAVTGACMMVPADLFTEVGGYLDAFPLDYGDTEFCLRAVDAGLRVVFTPHAALLHRQSATRPRHIVGHPGEELATRWGERFVDGDPLLHPAFTDGDTYLLGDPTRSSATKRVPVSTVRPAMPETTPTTEVDAPLLSCEPPLGDGPAYFHNEVVVSGWALAPAGIAEVRVELDGTPLEVISGRTTPAVAEAHPGVDGAARAGFEARADCGDWPRGEHHVEVTAIDAEGERATRQGSIRIDPYGRPYEDLKADVLAGRTVMYCDKPALDGTHTAWLELEIGGWAYAAEGIETVLVTLDHRHRYQATTGRRRQDLPRALGVPETEDAGFKLNLYLPDQRPGEHHLSIVAEGADGRLVGVEGVVGFAAPAGEAEGSGSEAPRPAAVDGDRGERPSPERLVPEQARGRLIVAEHQARYRWAAQTANGRDVLDAGCGVGYGSVILAQAGARSVTGVDRSPEAILNARQRAGGLANLQLADLRELPFPDASFDLITCFEAIEHVVDPDLALDELRRVLRTDGMLLISSPNRDVYTPGNPHHVHEYTPPELQEALAARFANVVLYRQHAHLASLLSDDEGFRSADAEHVIEAEVRKVAAAAEGELYTVAAAADGELPMLRGEAVVGEVFDYKEMTELAWSLEERVIVAEAEAAAGRAEARVSAMAREHAETLLETSEQGRRDAERWLAEHRASISWRVTAPLRWAKARARVLVGR